MIQFDPNKFTEFFKNSGYDIAVQSLLREGWMGAVNSLRQSRDDELTKCYTRNRQLLEEVEQLRKKVTHWKNNHDHQVKMSRTLRERGDLPVERLRFYDEFVKLTETVEEQRRIIETLNACIGGEGSTTIENIRMCDTIEAGE